MSKPIFKYFPKLREQLFTIVFKTDTRLGKYFDIILLWAIIFSVLSVMLESVKEIREAYSDWFLIFEWFFTILFTLEYFTRLFITAKPRKYALSFIGIIDLLSILPTFLILFAVGGSYLVVIRSIRLLRIFRILKLGRYLSEATVLSNALIASKHKILVFLGTVITLVMIMGTIMYLVEGESNGFTSIPRSMYWAIVTVTTVGYGDIAPQTFLGQLLASALMLMGFVIIAVPTGIVTSEITNPSSGTKKNKNVHQACKTCNKTDHDKDAFFCKYCSSKL